MLKRALPDLQIGVIVGSWAASLVQNHPLIDRVHQLDHWKTNRSGESTFQRWRRYRRMARTVLQELVAQNYDVVIECSPHFPNTIPLTYRARIPVRIGYSSGGCGPLLTHEVAWTGGAKSMAEYMADLAALVVKRSLLKMVLPPLPEVPFSLPEEYIVIHMGCGDPRKEWPAESWRQLCQKLSAEGHFLVFTGRGERERRMAIAASSGLSRCLNGCDQLSWLETIALIRRARFLIGVDTAAGHAAAAVEVPSVLIYSGIEQISRWKPLGPDVHPITYPVPCSPCRVGCATRECIRNVSVDQVYNGACGFSKNTSIISLDEPSDKNALPRTVG
jgi:ADP-heptose:LPS heptosyltransferase